MTLPKATDAAKTILLVDDDVFTLRVYSDVLKAEGFVVITASSGEEALDVLERIHIDLLITDIMMAKMDGWQLIENIRQKLRKDEVSLPIIVMSAFESAELEVKCFKYGANAWLTKPIHPLTNLTKLVYKLLGLTSSGFEL